MNEIMTVVPIIKAAVFSAQDHSAVDEILTPTQYYISSDWQNKIVIKSLGGSESTLGLLEDDVVVVTGQEFDILSHGEFERTYRII